MTAASDAPAALLTSPAMKSFLQRHRGLIGINLLCLSCLLPFINKPVHIDDSAYLWAAAHIRQHPLDPYGFDVNWYGRWEPMFEVMENPPLLSYYLAAWTAVWGWREVVLHAGMLLPALALASGTYLLARRLCPHPFAAAAASTVAPATLVSATTIMCDVSMLALFVWAVYLWVRGIDERRNGLLLAAAVIAAASALTKYFGVALIPLLGAYALFRTRTLGSWMLALLLCVMLLTAYQLWTESLYGRGLLLDAAGYAVDVRWRQGTGGLAKALTALSFVGGCSASIVAMIVFARGRKAAARLAIVAAVLLVVLVIFEPFGAQSGHAKLHAGAWLVSQVALFAAGGALLLRELALSWWRERGSADATLLLLWIAGTLVFATLLNWTNSARSLLPMVPAAAMAALRRPAASTRHDDDEDHDQPASFGRLRLAGGITLGAAMALAAAAGDQAFAQTARSAADAFAVRARQWPGTRWYLGHWGFQWYMEQRGFSSVDSGGSVLMPGEHIAVPENNTNVHKLPRDSIRTAGTMTFRMVLPITIMNPVTGAGFYSDVWGPLPFAFGPAPAEEYREDEVTRRMVLRAE